MRRGDYEDVSVVAFADARQAPPSSRHVPPAVRASAGIVLRCVVGLQFLRFMVLVAEAHAMIVTERSSDDELIHLCTSGAARESAHMRAACLKATVDRASPALARALTRGGHAFASELYVLFSEPFKACSLLGAVGVLSVLPWVSTLWTLFVAGNATGVAPIRGSDGDHTVVILRNGEMPWNQAPAHRASLRFRPASEGKERAGRVTDLP